jgi:hypothetical protein
LSCSPSRAARMCFPSIQVRPRPSQAVADLYTTRSMKAREQRARTRTGFC